MPRGVYDRTKRHNLGLRSGGNQDRVLRGFKVIKPACQVLDDKGEITTGPCQRDLGIGWYVTCQQEGHEPFYRQWDELKRVPVQAAEPDEDGDIVITGYKEKVVHHKEPRLHQVALSARVNNGSGLQMAWAEGCVTVTDPDINLAPFCEFWNCWSQDTRHYDEATYILAPDDTGWFCSDLHAKLVKADESEELLTVAVDERSRQRRAAQLASINV